MIYDARTNPRGFGLTIQQWPRDSRIMALARMLGYRIPAPSFTAPDATPARALLNHGVWRAWCPDCPFAAEDVWRGHAVFWCMKCGNLKAGRAWRPLLWPDNLAEIEATLGDYPKEVQNWEPWGAPVDLKAQADEWLAHAAAMVDPEHGLSDNEVAGADDPETYTTPVVAVTNNVITSSDANVDKGDIRYFRQFLSADPGGSGYWLQTSSASAAAWVARATALASALSELSAGASVGGNLTWTDNGEGVIFSSGSKIRDSSGFPGLLVTADSDSLFVYKEDQSAEIFRAVYAEAAPTFKGQSLIHTGNLSTGFAGLAARGTTLALTTSYQDVPSATVTATATGTYLVLATVRFNATSTDGYGRASVYVNGVAVSTAEMVGTTAVVQVTHPSCYFLTSVTSGHVVKLRAKKDSGSGASSIDDAYLAMIRVA